MSVIEPRFARNASKHSLCAMQFGLDFVASNQTRVPTGNFFLQIGHVPVDVVTPVYKFGKPYSYIYITKGVIDSYRRFSRNSMVLFLFSIILRL